MRLALIALSLTLSAAPATAAYNDQLILDVTAVPEGLGAVFVPTLTERDQEPAVLVFSGDKKVATGHTGRRIVVAPGEYRVELLTPGAPTNLSVGVTVHPDATSLVRPFYAAIVVSTVNTKRRPIARKYVVSNMEGAPVASGRTSAARDGRGNTLFVPAGRYQVSIGDSHDPDEPSALISVHGEEVLRYRLVVRDGVVLRTEPGEVPLVERHTPWTTRWRVGTNVGISSTRRQVAAFNGETLNVGGYTELDVTYDQGVHLARLSVGLQEAWLAVEAEQGRSFPLSKLTDRAQAELLYNLRLWRVVGPYLRGHAVTSLFDTKYNAPRNLTLRALGTTGSVTERALTPEDDVDLFRGLKPLILQESAGLAITAIDAGPFRLIGRAGPAARQAFYGGGQYVVSETETELNTIQLADYKGWGAEVSALASLRLDDALWIDISLESFTPKAQLFDGETLAPVFNVTGRVTYSFNDTVSLDYELLFGRPELVIDDLSISHLISVRAHASIL